MNREGRANGACAHRHAKVRAAAALAEFLPLESAGGVLLLGMAMLGLAAANSPLAMLYGRLLSLPFTVKLGSLAWTSRCSCGSTTA